MNWLISGSKGLVKSGVGNNGPNVATKTDFYVTPEGITYPSTGYRAIGGAALIDAANGNIMSNQNITYFTFDDISKMSGSQIKDALQLNYVPTHYSSFNTLQIIDDIQIPKTYWNKGLDLEPIVSSYGSLGSGGATQAITTTTIKNFELNKIKQ